MIWEEKKNYLKNLVKILIILDMEEEEKIYRCFECCKSYKRKLDLNRYIRLKRVKYICLVCNYVFNRKDNFVIY